LPSSKGKPDGFSGGLAGGLAATTAGAVPLEGEIIPREVSQKLDGGREVTVVDPLHQIGRVPSDGAGPVSPALPGQINLEAWVMIIVERTRPK